jgi:hypothetical protein
VEQTWSHYRQLPAFWGAFIGSALTIALVSTTSHMGFTPYVLIAVALLLAFMLRNLYSAVSFGLLCGVALVVALMLSMLLLGLTEGDTSDFSAFSKISINTSP